MFKDLLRGLTSFAGRRTFRPARKRSYHFQAQYVRIEGTQRHCHRHPAEAATHFELNAQDASYRRPVCNGCAEVAVNG